MLIFNETHLYIYLYRETDALIILSDSIKSSSASRGPISNWSLRRNALSSCTYVIFFTCKTVLARECGGRGALDNIVATCDMRGNYPFPVSFAIVIKDGAGANALDRCADRNWLWRSPWRERRFHSGANATKCLSHVGSSRRLFIHFCLFSFRDKSPLFAIFFRPLAAIKSSRVYCIKQIIPRILSLHLYASFCNDNMLNEIIWKRRCSVNLRREKNEMKYTCKI